MVYKTFGTPFYLIHCFSAPESGTGIVSCGHWTDQSAHYTTVLRCLDKSPAVFNSVLRLSAVSCGVLRSLDGPVCTLYDRPAVSG